jgi:probable rRNA maturation factor
VVPAHEVQQLNRDYAGEDAATDVLSFSYVESEATGQKPAGDQRSETEHQDLDPVPASGIQSPHRELGDVVISQEHIREQAREAETGEETEFLLLLLHGALHILGFDHQNPEEQRRMDDMQANLMHQLGLSYRDFGWREGTC